jgi:hypothetical protein
LNASSLGYLQHSRAGRSARRRCCFGTVAERRSRQLPARALRVRATAVRSACVFGWGCRPARGRGGETPRYAGATARSDVSHDIARSNGPRATGRWRPPRERSWAGACVLLEGRPAADVTPRRRPRARAPQSPAVNEPTCCSRSFSSASARNSSSCLSTASAQRSPPKAMRAAIGSRATSREPRSSWTRERKQVRSVAGAVSARDVRSSTNVKPAVEVPPCDPADRPIGDEQVDGPVRQDTRFAGRTHHSPRRGKGCSNRSTRGARSRSDQTSGSTGALPQTLQARCRAVAQSRSLPVSARCSHLSRGQPQSARFLKRGHLRERERCPDERAHCLENQGLGSRRHP